MSLPARPAIDALLAAAGIDLLTGVQLTGAANAAAVDPTQPALILLGDPATLAPAALRRYPSDTPARLLLGVPGAFEVRPVSVGAIAADPALPAGAVALVLPALAPAQVRHDLHGAAGVIRRLRDPQSGCPWDLEQTHRSLRPHLLEEAYEVLAALDDADPARLREELGDLLLQILLHAQIASDAGRFDIGDVSETLREKLVRRHPHVFGDAPARNAEEVAANWDRIKDRERRAPAAAAPPSALDGVPQALPALARAQTLAARAARRGFAWPSDDAVLAKLDEELRELAEASDNAEHAAAEFGDLLFVLADFARRHAIHAEDALREAAAKFERRFRALETVLQGEGREMDTLPVADLIRRWDQVKRAEPAPT